MLIGGRSAPLNALCYMEATVFILYFFCISPVYLLYLPCIFPLVHQKDNLECRLGCPHIEDQSHVFTQCIWVNPSPNASYENIFKGPDEQKETIQVFIQKESQRKHLLHKLMN